MTTTRSVVVHPDADLLAQAVAARLLTAILDAQASRGTARVVLTGGGVGIATLAALADLPGLGAVDWSCLDLWWGDERFLPTGHPDRNETQAREALLDHVPVPPERLHPVPPAHRSGAHDRVHAAVDDAGTAALVYAQELAQAHRAENGQETGDGPSVPVFDVVLLGMGPDGHVASLFSGHPALRLRDAAAIAVHDSPKPPPVRVSLTLPTLCTGHDVWILAAGKAKAQAVAQALEPAGHTAAGQPADQLPAALVHGTCATRWLLDEQAASFLGR